MSYFRAEISLCFRGLKAVDAVSFAVGEGRDPLDHRPQRRRKKLIFNLISRIYPPTSARSSSRTRRSPSSLPTIARLGIARTFQNIELFEKRTVLANLLVGRHGIPPSSGRKCCSCRAYAPAKSCIAAASSR